VAGLHTVPGQRDDHANAEDLSMRVLARRARPLANVARLAPAYQPRKPTETILYGVVRETLETFVAHARETYAAPLPRYVERELRGYLRCGVSLKGSLAAIATRAVGICSWPSRARAAASAPAALEGAWPTRPPTWSTSTSWVTVSRLLPPRQST
jgi:hypothetical protein